MAIARESRFWCLFNLFKQLTASVVVIDISEEEVNKELFLNKIHRK